MLRYRALCSLSLLLALGSGCSCADPNSNGRADADVGPNDSGGGRTDASDAARDANTDARRDVGVDAIVVGPDGMFFPDGAPMPDAFMMPDANVHPDTGLCGSDMDCPQDTATCTLDHCVAGTCQHSIDSSICVDDALFCNGGVQCAPTSSLANATTGCAPTPAPNCDDGLSCTMDSCSETTHACVNMPTNTVCDDSMFCNGAEHCGPGTAGADARGCVLGTPPVCNDGFACTTDRCDNATSACIATPNNASCSNGLFCDGAETCAPGSAGTDANGCIAGVVVNCDDGFACTSDSCNEGAGSCAHVASDAVCADGLFCDGVERCMPGAGSDARGCAPGTPVVCPQGAIACIVPSCNEASMMCIGTPTSTLCSSTQVCDPASGCVTGMACSTSGQCSDNNVCNGIEACTSSICRAGTPLNCDDGIPCTIDACDPTGGCTHTPSNAVCDDHLVCNGIEFCSATLGCQAGTAPVCNDSIACTTDMCSESAGGCTHTPVDTVCADGVFCNGAEVCTAGVGCQPGAPPACSDGIACTMDMCSSATDMCTHAPVDAACSNNVYCDGVETCSASLGCRAGAPINCNDGVACSVDQCIEATHMCQSTYDSTLCTSGMVCTATGCQTGRSCTGPTASVCDDGQFCNGLETCSSSTSTPGICQPGVPPMCDDGRACTTDACSNALAICVHTPWDQDRDGFCDLSCFGFGCTDCNDMNAAIHPGAVEICNNVDTDCDGTPNNGLLADGAMCSTPSMCCDRSCAGSVCTRPSSTCLRTSTICTQPSDCCSGRCSLEVDGRHHCTLDGGCHIGGEACVTAADCCSTGCVAGVCSDTVTCHPQSTGCTTNAQCCSNLCTAGTCASAGTGCQVDGEVCSSNGNCCGGQCLFDAASVGHCAPHDYCRAGGDICTTNAQCCDGGCNSATHRCEILGSCSVAGEPCTGQRSCCSALCTDSTGSGVRTCQHLDGCRPYGETCTTNSLCCSHQCGVADALGVRRCVNPPGCVDAGEICAQGGSNDCCVLRTLGCQPTGLGVSRCNNLSMCVMTGGLCEFDAQCCSGGRCLLQSDGTLRCGTMCVADGFACLSNTDCCNGSCINGFCQPASSGCTPTGSSCATSAACCSLNCDLVCFP